jgi:hypothetical protein
MTSWRVHGSSEINILPRWYVFLRIFSRNLCYVIIREYEIYDISTRTCNKFMNSFPCVTRDVLVLFWYYVFLRIFSRNLCCVIIREYEIYDISTRTCNKFMNSFPCVTRDVLVLFWYYAHLQHAEFNFHTDRWRTLVNAVMNLSVP